MSTYLDGIIAKQKAEREAQTSAYETYRKCYLDPKVVSFAPTPMPHRLLSFDEWQAYYRLVEYLKTLR